MSAGPSAAVPMLVVGEMVNVQNIKSGEAAVSSSLVGRCS